MTPAPSTSATGYSMYQRIITHAGVSILMFGPAQAEQYLTPLVDCLPSGDPGASPAGRVEIDMPAEGRFSIRSEARKHTVQVGADELAGCLLIMLTGELVHHLRHRPALHAAALAFAGRGILLPGTRGAGKTSLAAWLAAHGCEYLTDELVCITADGRFDCFHAPMNVRTDDYPRMAGLLDMIGATILPGRDLMLAAMPPDPSGTVPPALILLPEFRRSATSLSLEVLTPAKAAVHMMPCLLNGRHLAGGGFGDIAALARTTPALRFTYGATAQLAELPHQLLALLSSGRCTPGEMRAMFAPFRTPSTSRPLQAQEPQTTTVQTTAEAIPIPAATPPGPKKKLTIGMATYDDFDGVYFTAHAIRLYHPEVTADTEILVVDNNPGGRCGKSLKGMENEIEGFRYVPMAEHSGTAIRDYLFCHAAGEFVLVLDCHVLLAPGTLARLLAYLDAHPDCMDLLQGPMCGAKGAKFHTHFVPTWQKGMYGVWGYDEQGQDVDTEPFDIPMQGLGLFCCRNAAWPGFNPRFRGFGGEEGYIHEKIRQRGGRTLCLPFLRWRHRFARPLGVPYRNTWEDRIFNYMVGFSELGLDTQPVREHFLEHLGQGSGDRIFEAIEQEMQSPLFFFDAIYCITLDPDGPRYQKMRQRFRALGIEHRVRAFRAIATPDNHHVGCALSHRAVIAQASRLRLNNVLVFEDDALFHLEALSLLAQSIAELRRQDWRLFYLGGHRWDIDHPLAEGCQALRQANAQGPTCTHALAYHSAIFPHLLAELPDTIEGMADWLVKYKGIDQYLRRLEGVYLAEPVVATQVELLPQEAPEHRGSFTLGEA